jgi:hypothetical protein
VLVAKRSFEVSTTVPGPPPVVIDFLMDLEKHRGLHPYLVSATVSGTGRSHLGPWWDWQVEERPRVGPVPYSLRFRVRMTRTSPTSLESRLTALPGCHLRALTRAVATADGSTLVTEKVAAKAPPLIVGYLARKARTAHTRTYARLPAALALETQPDGP